MSLNRIAVRTAMVTAINNLGTAPYPTIAGPHVFDSKIEPVDSVEKDVAYPLVVVYTDYDRGHIANTRTINDERVISITLELIIGIIKKDAEVPNQFVLQYPVTDSELEASLDILEAQVFEALRADNVMANTFRTICYAINDVVSRRGASTEGGTKVAARQITIEAVCLKEPASPALAPWMDEFLTTLSGSDGFGLVADQLRAIYEAGSATGDIDRLRKTMGWSDDTYAKLGYPSKPFVILGTPVVWLDQTGAPL